ncbi:killer cell lectin-like receptor subfamily B member 1B allele C [Hypanus sabinus]|uniref:killer cell lectin-like receptor subfamily B member 1B allele C n=1 Tax=Hypanus sabinus TaxID=79690 RepID=UPI0028C4BD2A|nr:killer cell lectin-like receptor subfamily B member 1B allele C [Hypanus sabinus]
MDDSETYMIMQIVKPDSLSPSRAAHEKEPKGNIGRRPYRLICLLCLVMSALAIIVAGLSIHGEWNGLRVETDQQTCSKEWVTNNDRCYYVSPFEASFPRAMQECSNRDSRLLEINSSDETSLVSHKLLYRNLAHWIGKCENGTVGLALLYNVSPGTSVCRDCGPRVGSYPCDSDRRFICEKSAPLLPDIPEEIQGLCQ